MDVIIAQNTNLFEIAAKYLGDPMQWITIARANGLKDPFIGDLMQIAIPNYDPGSSNGIGSQ